MNIKRIVVDELPEGCIDCLFWNNATVNPDYQDDHYICDITLMKIDLNTRPDWCPLVKESEGE